MQSFPLLSITFSQLSKVAPKQFVSLHSNPILSLWSFSFLGPCVYIKEEEEMKRSQALFTLICFPLFAFLLATDCLLFDFCTFLLTTWKGFDTWQKIRGLTWWSFQAFCMRAAQYSSLCFHREELVLSYPGRSANVATLDNGKRRSSTYLVRNEIKSFLSPGCRSHELFRPLLLLFLQRSLLWSHRECQSSKPESKVIQMVDWKIVFLLVPCLHMPPLI